MWGGRFLLGVLFIIVVFCWKVGLEFNVGRRMKLELNLGLGMPSQGSPVEIGWSSPTPLALW